MINANSVDLVPGIYTFGGDRETFDFTDPLNYLNIDDDVWRFALPWLLLFVVVLTERVLEAPAPHRAGISLRLAD